MDNLKEAEREIEILRALLRLMLGELRIATPGRTPNDAVSYAISAAKELLGELGVSAGIGQPQPQLGYCLTPNHSVGPHRFVQDECYSWKQVEAAPSVQP